eukprot:1160115-Pelagomonas_calceolata.AAC.5
MVKWAWVLLLDVCLALCASSHISSRSRTPEDKAGHSVHSAQHKQVTKEAVFGGAKHGQSMQHNSEGHTCQATCDMIAMDRATACRSEEKLTGQDR